MSYDIADTARRIKADLDAARSGAAGYQDMQRLMNRYAMERFLYRIGRSRFADAFILKGALLLALYIPDAYRSTRDADFLGIGTFDAQLVIRMLTEVCADEQDDGLIFDFHGITVQTAGRDREYPGYAVVIPTRLSESNCHIKLDLGFGEVVVPPAQRVEYPTILTMPKPTICVYPLETIIAEKFQAIVYLGQSNTRMKDYHDLHEIARHCTVNGATLSDAIMATFERRGTDIPAETPVGSTTSFYASRSKAQDWTAFLRRHALPKRVRIVDACHSIEQMVMPVAQAAISNAEFSGTWYRGEWRPD